MKKTIATFEEAAAYILDTPKFTTKNSLEATRAFLRRLGSPDQKLKIIHVAGTNGKGSVCAYLRSILEEAGKTVACFTSPHLVDIRERFYIGGENIGKAEFLTAFQKIYALLEEGENGFCYHPTFFEFLFFIAMLVFAEKNPDYCILETGLGGRLDATNAVSDKVLTVITRIGPDHMQYLGDTVEKIAGEKAGIIKEGVPVVYLQTPECSAIFEERAKQMSAKAYPVSKSDYSFLKIKNKSIDFSYASGYYGNVSLHLSTMARYQMENCALALRAIEVLQEEKITLPQMQSGVEKCFWAGRMEEVRPEVFADGAHNADGVRAFLETVCEDGFPGERTLLFGASADKDIAEMLKKICESRLFTKLYLVKPAGSRGAAVSRMAELLTEHTKAVAGFDSVERAMTVLLSQKKEQERIYIAGSLYLVGEVKAFLAASDEGEKNDQF